MPLTKAVIFDFDGVIVDTQQFHADAWEKTFQEHGLTVSREQCLPAIELEDHVFAAGLLKSLGCEEDPRKWVYRKQFVFRTLLSQIKIYPGVIQLVQQLAPHFKLAIVSSAWIENIETVTRSAGIIHLFTILVGKETVSIHKPAPDGYLKAAKLLGIEPQNCTVIEDSPSGIRSAKAAGMRCIGVAHRNNLEQLKEADLVVPNLIETEAVLKLIVQ
ncbi:MAG: HAD family hydrolase [Bacillota bacterium]|jgi:beta-phosphoglucomutase